MERLKQCVEKYKLLIIVVPLFIGGIGYCMEGESFLNALYGSFCLYFANPIFDEVNILIEIARWTAPIVAVVKISQIIIERIEYQSSQLSFFLNCGKNIIYSNYITDMDLGKGMRKSSIIISDGVKKWKRNQIIMFNTDMENFSFYSKYEKELTGKKIYMCLHETDPALLKSNPNVNFIHINDAIARTLWKDEDICQRVYEHSDDFKIAIWGFNDLGKHVLEKALQLNLYSVNQKITYYVVGEHDRYRNSHRMFNLMNNDEIRYFDEAQTGIWDLLHEMDIVIITTKADIDLMQTVLYNSKCPIYYYSPNNDNMSKIADTARLIPYGQNEILLTDDNIIRDELYKSAKELNDEYNRQNNKEPLEWKCLHGFTRESNISAADYGEIIGKLYSGNNENTEEHIDELAQLEHIRWCRFHFLHYWRSGAGIDGGKDTDNRLHPYLVPYNELTEDIKENDRINVRNWIK